LLIHDSLHYATNYYIIRLDNHKLSVKVHSLSNSDTLLIYSVKEVSIIVIYHFINTIYVPLAPSTCSYIGVFLLCAVNLCF